MKNYARGGDVRPADNEYRGGREVGKKKKSKHTKLAGQPWTGPLGKPPKERIPVWNPKPT